MSFSPQLAMCGLPSSTNWGVNVEGLLQIRAAYVDPDGTWWRSDYQYFARDNQLTVSHPLNNSTAAKGSILTIAGTTYPARANDTIIIDVIDSANHYTGGVATTTTHADGRWSITIPANYPTGRLQVRAANTKGWWARADYVNITPV